MIRLCIETPSNEIFDQAQELLFKLGYEWNGFEMEIKGAQELIDRDGATAIVTDPDDRTIESWMGFKDDPLPVQGDFEGGYRLVTVEELSKLSKGN
ncbi:hypothetical protein [Acinetobacter variabilis]|uniref:hypothetical protein n=1 Tax=Acinetobacter variabilis TaxID=70346 RepID=UPI0030523C38